MAAPARPAAGTPGDAPGDALRDAPGSAPPRTEDEVRALIALAALGGPERLAHEERVALGRALHASPGLRAELRALAAVAAALPPAEPARPEPPVLRSVPDVLLRPDVLAALAALLLALGVLRLVADAGATGGPETVTTATVSSITGTAAVTARPWGTEVRIQLDGTQPGAVYHVVVTDRSGRASPAGDFLGGEGTVRYVGTAGVERGALRSVRVTDERGQVVLRADLA